MIFESLGEGPFVIFILPPPHHVIIRHLLADPPSPSGDDVIYEQSLREASSLLGNQRLEQLMTEQCYHRWYTRKL